ncbi:MAG: DUF1893 domain-containing protein [Firmicutes bacterium]|nr:DUF1893 domain-containing protein [Bacillota bacterium]
MEISKKMSKKSLIIFSPKEGITAYDGKGIKPLISAIIKNATMFQDAFCVDKVIGIAAALLFVYVKVKAVYANVISQKAIEVFKNHNITFDYAEKTSFIQNQDKSDECPMELLCKNITDPEKAYFAIKEKLQIP